MRPAGTLARVSTAPTRCRSCGRETATTEDWRCEHCRQPKPLTAAELTAAEPAATNPGAAERPSLARRPPTLWEDLRPQLAAAAVSALIAVAGLVWGSELLLIAAAAVLVAAVVSKIITDGW